MKILDLFSGTRSISKAFERSGHKTFSIDYNDKHPNIDWYVDILTVTSNDILERFGQPNVIWASPDCTTFSIASISHHREKLDNGLLIAKSDKAKLHDKLLEHTIMLINELEPKYYFIENPRGAMRKSPIMKDLTRYTVTYCQYGDTRMKPTDIWTNHPNPNFKPMCKNGDTCHVSSPRGSQTGTQGLKGAIQRSVIPDGLCDYIVEICEVNN